MPEPEFTFRQDTTNNFKARRKSASSPGAVKYLLLDVIDEVF